MGLHNLGSSLLDRAREIRAEELEKIRAAEEKKRIMYKNSAVLAVNEALNHPRNFSSELLIPYGDEEFRFSLDGMEFSVQRDNSAYASFMSFYREYEPQDIVLWRLWVRVNRKVVKAGFLTKTQTTEQGWEIVSKLTDLLSYFGE